MKADMHIHSTFSDGGDSINKLIEKAKEKGLDAIAITDHDTLSHLSLIPADGDIKVIGGVEISAIHHLTKKKAHILAYNIKNPGPLPDLVGATAEARNRNSEKQVRILSELGFRMELDNIPRADGKYMYKQHIMDWLVCTGQVPDMFGDFYKKTFRNGGVCDFDIVYPDVFDAVRAVKSAGGLAVLAHPGQQQNFSLIPELVENGLDGLELYHYENNEKAREIIKDYADRYGLFLTGGSDYHGKYGTYSFEIGDFLSDDSGVDAIFRPIKSAK